MNIPVQAVPSPAPHCRAQLYHHRSYNPSHCAKRTDLPVRPFRRKSFSTHGLSFESFKEFPKLLISMARDTLLGFPSHTLSCTVVAILQLSRQASKDGPSGPSLFSIHTVFTWFPSASRSSGLPSRSAGWSDPRCPHLADAAVIPTDPSCRGWVCPLAARITSPGSTPAIWAACPSSTDCTTTR